MGGGGAAAYFFSLNLYLSNGAECETNHRRYSRILQPAGRAEVTIITPVKRGKLDGGCRYKSTFVQNATEFPRYLAWIAGITGVDEPKNRVMTNRVAEKIVFAEERRSRLRTCSRKLGGHEGENERGTKKQRIDTKEKKRGGKIAINASDTLRKRSWKMEGKNR